MCASVTLGLDRVVRMAPGAGGALCVERGPLGDGALFARFGTVRKDPNPHDRLVVRVPGAGAHASDVLSRVGALRQLRQALGLPPRGADLWRAA